MSFLGRDRAPSENGPIKARLGTGGLWLIVEGAVRAVYWTVHEEVL
jgi:hypothetical protein